MRYKALEPESAKSQEDKLEKTMIKKQLKAISAQVLHLHPGAMV